MIHQFLRLVCLATLVVGVCACGSKKASVRKPVELEPLERPEVGVKTEWVRELGKSDDLKTDLGMVVTYDGLYVADANGRVVALEPESGKKRWSERPTHNLQAGPAVTADSVLVGNRNGTLVALSAADGEEMWRRRVNSEVLGSPAGNGDIVVVRTVDGLIYGLSALTGTERWVVNRNTPSLVLRGMSDPLLAGGDVIVGLENGRLLSLSSYDGTVRWEQTISVPQGRSELDRLTDIDGDLVDGLSCVFAVSFGGQIGCIDQSTGSALWRRDITSWQTPAYDDQKLYVTDESGKVWALDERSGAAAWSQDALLYRGVTAPVVFGDYVVVADYEGYLHFLSRGDGRLAGRYRVGNTDVIDPPVASNHFLFVRNRLGELYTLSYIGEPPKPNDGRAVLRRSRRGAH